MEGTIMLNWQFNRTEDTTMEAHCLKFNNEIVVSNNLGRVKSKWASIVLPEVAERDSVAAVRASLETGEPMAVSLGERDGEKMWYINSDTMGHRVLRGCCSEIR